MVYGEIEEEKHQSLEDEEEKYNGPLPQKQNCIVAKNNQSATVKI